MKTSGIKIENFPILGEVTCKARDPFSSSLPGDFFFPFFPVFLPFFSLAPFLLPFFLLPEPGRPPPPPSHHLHLLQLSSSSPSSDSREAAAAAAAAVAAENRGFGGQLVSLSSPEL